MIRILCGMSELALPGKPHTLSTSNYIITPATPAGLCYRLSPVSVKIGGNRRLPIGKENPEG